MLGKVIHMLGTFFTAQLPAADRREASEEGWRSISQLAQKWELSPPEVHSNSLLVFGIHDQPQVTVSKESSESTVMSMTSRVDSKNVAIVGGELCIAH
jgi:hypothetical protein